MRKRGRSVGIGMIIKPCGRGRGCLEVLSADCEREIAANFAIRKIQRVNIDVGFTFLDHFRDIGGR
jgi:hypothetical protein